MQRRSKRFQPYNQSQGKFQKKCGSNIHDIEHNRCTLLDLHTKKKITLADISLLDRDIINERMHYVCEEFLALVKHSNKGATIHKTISNQVGSESDSDHSVEERVSNFVDMGTELSKLIIPDVTRVHNSNADMKQITNLLRYQPLQWLNSRPPELVHFIANLCNIDINTAPQSKLVVIAKIIELVYYSRNSKLILPNHFHENLLNYSFTNSKTMSNFLGSRSPGGSSSYISSWLLEQAHDPIKCP